MSPMQRSVTANPQSRMYEGVLSDGCLQITAKITVFPTTAKGDIMATIMAIENVAALTAEL